VAFGIASMAPGWAIADDADAPGEPQNSEDFSGAAAPGASVSIAALGGLVFGSEAEPAGIHHVGRGYGVRVGRSSETTPLYLGGTLLWFTQESGEGTRMDTAAFDFELGYDVRAGSFTLRPFLGAGVLLGVFDGPDGGNSAIWPHLFPGLLARYSIGPVDLGVEARYEWILEGKMYLSVLGSAGTSF
jgi:hypothetical protein